MPTIMGRSLFDRAAHDSAVHPCADEDIGSARPIETATVSAVPAAPANGPAPRIVSARSPECMARAGDDELAAEHVNPLTSETPLILEDVQ